MFTPLCKFFHLLQQRPGWLFLSALLVTLLALFPLKDFKVRAAYSDLLPEEWESVKAWKDFGQKFGSAGHLAVVVHSPHPAANATVVESLARHLETHPQVNFLEYRTEADFYRAHPLLYISLPDLQEIEHRVQTGFWVNRTKRNPLILDLISDEEKEEAFDATSFEDLEAKYFSRLKDLLGAADSTTLALRLYPSFDVTDIHACRAFFKDVQTAATGLLPPSDSIEVLYTGDVLRNIQNEGRLFSGVLETTRLALALSALLLLVNFLRFPVGALLAGIPVGMAVIWTLALTQLWLGPLGFLSAPLGLLLVGLGLSGAIHLLARYAEERRKRLSAPVAFETITLETGPGIAAGLLTLAVAFLTFLATDFRALGDFGLMAGIGMVCTVIAVLAVFPSLLRLVEPTGLLNPLGPRLYNFSGHGTTASRPRWALPAALAMTVLLAGSGPQTRFQYDFNALGFPEENRKADSLLTDAGESLGAPVVFLTPGHSEAEAVAGELRRRAAAGGKASAIGEVATLLDLLPADQEEKIRIAARLRRSITPDMIARTREPLRSNLEKLTENWPVRPLGVSDLPRNYRQKFLGRDSASGVFTYAFAAQVPDEGVHSLRFADQVRSVEAGGRTYFAGGWPVVYGDLVSRLVPDVRQALLFGFLAILLVLILTVRSLAGGAVLMLPVLATLLWMLGAMKWMHLKLNPFDLIAFPAAMAYATIHSLQLYHRYEEEGRGSLIFVLRRTGRTALVTTLVGAAGFIPMAFADHRGLASLGKVAMLGLVLGLAAALLLIPGALGWWEGRKQKRERS